MEIIAAKTGVESSKNNREAVLREFVRFSWRATRGLTKATEGEARDLVSRIAELGRVTPEEGERLLATLSYRMKQSQDVFEGNVAAAVGQATERLKELATRQASAVASRTTSVEQRLNEVWKRRKGK